MLTYWEPQLFPTSERLSFSQSGGCHVHISSLPVNCQPFPWSCLLPLFPWLAHRPRDHWHCLAHHLLPLGLHTCSAAPYLCPSIPRLPRGLVHVPWLYSCPAALHVASQPHARIKAPCLSRGSVPIPWPHEHPRALYMSHAAPFSLWVFAVWSLMPQTGMWFHDPGWILSLLLGSRMLITTGGAVVENF